MRQMNKLAVVASFMLLAANVLADDLDFLRVDCDNGLAVEASFEKTVRTFTFWENFSFTNESTFIFGLLTVSNPTTSSQNISTKNIRLESGGSALERGYKKTVASDIIDISHVPVEPQGSMEIEMYWPIPLAAGQDIGKLGLSCVIAS